MSVAQTQNEVKVVHVIGDVTIYSADDNFNQMIDGKEVFSTTITKLNESSGYIFTSKDNALGIQNTHSTLMNDESETSYSGKSDSDVLQKAKKQFPEKMMAQEKRRQNKEIEKIKAATKPAEMVVTFPISTQNTLLSQSTDKNIVTAGQQNYSFAEKSFELIFFVTYYFRDFYQIEQPKFSKDVSSLISGRAPPMFVG